MSMSSAATLPVAPLRDFSDRLSPMVVKEMRQGLRGKVFVSMLVVFQLIMTLVVAMAAGGESESDVRTFFWLALMLVMLVGLPMRGFGLLAAEQKEGTLDMLMLTSISSMRIVFGKWLALFTQSLLLVVSLLPYMLARYHFGGVEVVNELVALYFVLLLSALLSAAVVAFSSQASIVLRLFLVTGLGAVTFPAALYIFLAMQGEASFYLGSIISAFGSHLLLFLGFALLVAVYGVFAFLAFGASRIAPVSENHSTWKRVVHLLALSALGAGIIVAAEVRLPEGMVMTGYMMSAFLTLVAGMDVMTEKMPRFPSAIEGLVTRRWLPFPARRMLAPGWVAGVWFYLLLMAVNLVALIPVSAWIGKSEAGQMFGCFFCLLVSAVVPVTARMNRNNLFANWVVAHLCLLAYGILVALLTGVTGRGAAYLGVFTPLTSLFAFAADPRGGGILLGCFFSLCWLCAALARATDDSETYETLERDLARRDSKTPLQPKPVETPTPAAT